MYIALSVLKNGYLYVTYVHIANVLITLNYIPLRDNGILILIETHHVHASTYV